MRKEEIKSYSLNNSTNPLITHLTTCKLKLNAAWVIDTPLAAPVVPEDEKIPAIFSSGLTLQIGIFSIDCFAVVLKSSSVELVANFFSSPITITKGRADAGKSSDSVFTISCSTAGEQNMMLGRVNESM